MIRKKEGDAKLPTNHNTLPAPSPPSPFLGEGDNPAICTRSILFIVHLMNGLAASPSLNSDVGGM